MPRPKTKNKKTNPRDKKSPKKMVRKKKTPKKVLPKKKSNAKKNVINKRKKTTIKQQAPKTKKTKSKISRSSVTKSAPKKKTSLVAAFIDQLEQEKHNTNKQTESPSQKIKEAKPQQTVNYIKKQNNYISPHILDLKKIKEQQNQQNQSQQDKANKISNELLDRLAEPKLIKRFIKQEAQTNKQRPQTSFTVYHQKTINQEISQPKRRLMEPKLPKLRLPKFKLSFPKINLPQIQPVEIKIGGLTLPRAWTKRIAIFLIFAFLFIMPFTLYNQYQTLQGKKENVLQKTAQALFHLTISQKAASAQHLYYTQLELSKASNSFAQAKQELDNINFLTQTLIKITPKVNKQFITAQNLISAGEKLSASGAILTQTLTELNLNDSPDKLNLTDKLIVLKDKLNLILPDIRLANQNLQEIYLEEIPLEYQDKIKMAQTALPFLQDNIEKFISYSDVMLNLLGHEQTQRYLFLFQNNHEIRPTGGFIGSFALVDIDRGNIKKINIPGGGPYDLQGKLKANIESPRPLHLMNQRWEFQDANWFANLPNSAEKIIWFYEQSGGPTVDGIVFINATFLEDMLKIIGPIQLENYDKTINSENFFTEVQKSVELEYDKEINKPKQIIADLTPIIIDELLNSDQQQFTEILDTILNSLISKEIQFYFTDYSVEKIVMDYNWGGQIKSTDKDYLNIVSTNIAGEKTDAKIQQSADLDINIQDNGAIINTITLTRKHNGQAGEIFYGVPHLDYLRFYVPKGSQLISAQGFDLMDQELFKMINPQYYQKDPDIALIEATREIELSSQTEIFTENDKTVFANWLRTEPGQTKTVTISYQLPFKLNFTKPQPSDNYLNLIMDELDDKTYEKNYERYSLIWQKQSGRNNFDININLSFPHDLNYQILYPENKLIREQNNFIFTDHLDTDKLLGVIFKL